MSDTVWLAIIGIVAMIVKHILDERSRTVTNAKLEVNTVATIEQGKQLDDVKNDVHKIELATNSMKDALVESTRSGAQAAGELKGRADSKAEALHTESKLADSVEAVPEKTATLVVDKLKL